jgi:hypothetical protein
MFTNIIKNMTDKLRDNVEQLSGWWEDATNMQSSSSGASKNNASSPSSGTSKNTSSSSSSSSGASKNTAPSDLSFKPPAATVAPKGDYKPSGTVNQALSALEAQLAAKPAEYRGEWENKLKEQMDRILNREAFSYDLNSDPFYQQYADLFARQGEMAMLDTMGRAQGATGGYGSSYAQSVGQQAYQEHLKGLTDIAPELYSQAYDRYEREGDRLYDEYALMKQEDSEDYARYQDGVARYYDDLDRAYDRYDSERSFDYSKYADQRDFDYAKAVDERDYNYNKALAEYNKALKEYAAATAPTGTSVPGAYKNMSMAEINSLLADANASGDDKLVQAIIDDLEKAGVITGVIADTLYTKYMVGGK